MAAVASDEDASRAGEGAPAPHVALSAVLPRQFGRYTLFEPIGRGGMAELFLARTETELGAQRLAVVKLILPAFADDPQFAEMLIHEAKLAAGLNHRHIVQVLDLGRDRDDDVPDVISSRRIEPTERLYIAMEYVEGFDLNGLLRKCTEQNEGLPAEHALGIVADVLEGLDYAHRRTDDEGRPLGIVHRDVSPSNVLLSYEGEVKLCDFGIAKANAFVRAATLQPELEALKGKAGYMSPEHARGELVDARSDVFAAGIILWELLSGRRLYKWRGDLPLLEQAKRAVIPPIPDRGLPNHEELEGIVSRALARDRDSRYRTASAFQRDLEGYLAGAGLLSHRHKLGDWLRTTFGTKVIEERRASESKLPRSIPPPGSQPARRSVSSIQVPLGSRSSVSALDIPVAPPIPKELLFERPPDDDDDDSDWSGLKDLSAPKFSETRGSVDQRQANDAIESPKGASMDQRAVSSDEAPASKKAADDEMLRWARRRGIVTFLFFCSIACVIAIVWYLSR